MAEGDGLSIEPARATQIAFLYAEFVKAQFTPCTQINVSR